MSGKEQIDVLAVIDDLVSFEERMAEAEPRANHEAREALAAVAELIEADREYDAAGREWDYYKPYESYQRKEAAHRRRAAALANIGATP